MVEFGELKDSLETLSARREAVADVEKRIEDSVTRAAALRPARDALTAADASKAKGNAAFTSGDYPTAAVAYAQAIAFLDPALQEPTTSYAAECALLILLANTAQVALKMKNPKKAAKFCRDALRLSVCTHKEALFKKVLVRLATALDLDEDASIEDAHAVVVEAQLRGLEAEEFDAIARKAKQPKQGTLRQGVEMRMFVMLSLRLSAGAENLERMKGLLQSGDLPHVDRRDEVGNNVLWGTLNALTITDDEVAGGGGGQQKNDDPNDNRGGESCVPMLALLLGAGADPNQRFEDGRTPLMYAAGSGYVSAVTAVLTANTFQKTQVHASDAKGWTALHVACATEPPPPSKHNNNNTRKSSKNHHHQQHEHDDECCGGDDPGGGQQEDNVNVLAVVRELLDAGADPRLRNENGQTPLMLASMKGACDVVAELLRRDDARPGCGPELLRDHDVLGMSAVMIAHQTALKSGVLTDLLNAAEKAGKTAAAGVGPGNNNNDNDNNIDIEAEVKEDLKMMKWCAMRDKTREAHNMLLRRLVVEGGAALVNTPYAAAAAERTALGVWLAACGFDELPGGESADAPGAAKAAFDAYGDVYAAIHRHVSDIVPAVITKTFHPPTGIYPTDAEAGRLWFYTGAGVDKHQEDDDLPVGVNRDGKPKTVTWHGCGGGITADPGAGWAAMVSDCLTHAFSFAVPSNDALDAIANIGVPLVEIGAGTGYWAALLRQRGVDIVAIDSHPPVAVNKDVKLGDGNLFFQGTFTEVKEGKPSDLASHSDRSLFMCWAFNAIEAERRGLGDWDVACLDHWKGKTLIHVGEWGAKKKKKKNDDGEEEGGKSGGDEEEEDDDEASSSSPLALPVSSEEWPRGTMAVDLPQGVTTSRTFQERVEREFRLVTRVQVPNWPFLRDDLTVWERR